jgi:hypothetical protein
MKALRWILIGMALAVFLSFMFFNWTDVDIALGPWSLIIKKPALVLLAFLAGFAPTYLMHVAARTNWRRKLARAEKAASEALGAPASAEPREPLGQ